MESENTRGIRIDRQALVNIYLKGLRGELRDQIIELAFESERCFVVQCYKATIVLAAETMHRVNCELILHLAKSNAQVVYKFKSKKEKFALDGKDVIGDFKSSQAVLDSFSIFEAIHLLKNEGVISPDLALDMNVLRVLRNLTIHGGRLPYLLDYWPPDKPLSKEQINETVGHALKNEKLPPKYYMYKFNIRMGEQTIIYIVDQTKLGTDLENLEREAQFAAIALGILYSCLRQATFSS
jgi:hypothetical protein